jgi:hypothetical protein
MLKHNAIGACCSRPRFNFVGGVDDESQACAGSRTERQRGLSVLVPHALLDRVAGMARSIAAASADFGKR